MQNNDSIQARDLIRRFVGETVGTVERAEYQLRLIFESGSEFVVSSPWRLVRKGSPLIGSGDFREAGNNCTLLQGLAGLTTVDANVSSSWDSQLVFEDGYVLDVMPDTVKYEIWEAHLEIGWGVFAGGEVTLFPPRSGGQIKSSPRVRVYEVGEAAADEQDLRTVAAFMQHIRAIGSVGIAAPSKTGCRQNSHRHGNTFDIVELNGKRVSLFGTDASVARAVKDVQVFAVERGAREVYGPAGVYQNGAEVLVPELRARFGAYLHIALPPS